MSPIDNWFFQNISSISAKIRGKELSPVEIAGQMIRRIERLQPKLNAYIYIAKESALEQARVLEKELMEGRIRGPLHGVPIAVKDILQTAGMPTTAGSKILEHWLPHENATSVRKLYEAGAVLIGKTNLHEFAMGATSENPHYGTVRNPWNLQVIAGGSSGGSAVAVAAGLCFGALGTDTAGSIRLPSAVCGTVGLKPTYGRVSRHGCLPFSWSLDHVGPMTRTVEDTALLLSVIAGFDRKDPSSAQRPVDVYPYPQSDDLKDWKIGLCREYFFDGVHDEIAALIDRALQRLAELGAEIVEIRIPGLEEAQWALKIIAQAEGYSFHEPLLKRFPERYSEDVKFRLSFGSNVSANDYLKAQKIRGRFIRDTFKAMESVDVLASPMNHNPPFAIGSRTPEQAIHNMFYLAKAPLANLLGFPAISVPCGFISGGLPAGLQLIGKPFREDRLLQIADVYERTERWTDRLQTNSAYEV